MGVRSEFLKGVESARIHSKKDALLRSLLVAPCIVIAWDIDAAWYWKVGLFLLLMFAVGCVVQFFAIRSESRRAAPIPNRPRNPWTAAAEGAAIRQRLITLIEEIEREIGVAGVAYAKDEGALLVHPRVEEIIAAQPDAAILQPALTLCFLTPFSTRIANESWLKRVEGFMGVANTADILDVKAQILSTYLRSNLRAVDMHAVLTEDADLDDDAKAAARLEEAAL